ncbi:MAG: glycosyltransferase [Pirellulales bacterium]
MSRLVCYLPSYNDSELVAQSLATVPDWDVVISDNASDPAHAAALDRLASPRVQVIHQPRQLGRVGNWQFCVEHFLSGGTGGASWMKFLLAGDRHKPDSLAICERTIERFPQARFIITGVDMLLPNARRTSIDAPGPFVLQPPEAMLEVVRQGNVFFGLLAALIHADAVRDGFTFGEELLNYCADMYFLVNIGRRCPTLFEPELVSEFVSANRKVYQVAQHSLEHLVEECLVQLRAAHYYGDAVGDPRARDPLVPGIADWLRSGLNATDKIQEARQ